MKHIAEKDWKLLRKIKEEKLNLACGEILSNVENVIKSKKNENHKSYLTVWDLVKSGDKKIEQLFDDLGRSNAILKLALWRKNGLLSDQEICEFSEETRESIKNFMR